MAEMTIRLRVNPDTGKKDIIISLRSDDDAMPHEHEQQHGRLVAQLLERGVLSEEQLGDIVVEREEDTVQDDASISSRPQPQRESQQEGN